MRVTGEEAKGLNHPCMAARSWWNHSARKNHATRSPTVECGRDSSSKISRSGRVGAGTCGDRIRLTQDSHGTTYH